MKRRKGFINKLKVFIENLKGFINISKGKFNTQKDFMIRLKGRYYEPT